MKRKFYSMFAALLFIIPTFISCNFGVETYKVAVGQVNYNAFSSATGLTISDGYYIRGSQDSSALDVLPELIVDLTKEGIIDVLVNNLKLYSTDAKVECNNLICGKYAVFSRRGSTVYFIAS